MPVIQRSFQVSCQLRVFFTRGVFDSSNLVLQTALRQDNAVGRLALVVVDETLAQARPELTRRIEAYFAAHPAGPQLVCEPLIFEGGERVKSSPLRVSEIHSHIERYHMDRQSYVIAVGGGALLDMAGLAAATAHRGMRHVRIPTTTLSQCDSGVGVKNGINAFGKKNFIGVFAPPFAVVNDSDFLDSLAPRDKRAGYVEAVKVALIRDERFFEEIEREAKSLREFQPAPMRRLIYRCAELHLDHIATAGDPFELGAARPLDFGHWSAHKLEQMSDFKIRHGDAVAIGVALDAIYSRALGCLDGASMERILRVLGTLGFELWANELLHRDSGNRLTVLGGLEEFREHLGGSLCITLLKGIGRAFEVHEIVLPKMVSAIDELRARYAGQASKIVRVGV